MKVSRRQLLAGAAVGGGLLVAWSLTPREYDSPLSPAPSETAFDAWLKIGDDGVITVAVPQLEMGQGITTLLPQVVAMELGADWRQVGVEPAPVSGAYANLPLAAKWTRLWKPLIPSLAQEPDDLLLRRWAQEERFTVTAEGTSMAAYELPCREAAASARAMLAMAAANRWDVEWEECTAESGFIVHGENRASFAELAREAAGFSPPDPPPLKPRAPVDPAFAVSPAEAVVTDRAPAFPRLDLPSKVDGSFTFAGDVRLPDMVYAAIRHGPHTSAELVGYDIERVAGMAAVSGVVAGKRWLAATASNWWAAEQALTAMAPRFAAEMPARTERFEAQLDEAVRQGAAALIHARGAADEGFAPTFALRYDIAPALHAPIETASVTARLTGGRLELWLASQAPEAARAAAAKALGLPGGAVVLYPMAAGGSFDRRLDNDHAIEAALIARETGRPVQLIWSRAEESLASYPRPPAAGLIGAELTPEGRITALRARVAVPPSALEFGRRLFDNSTPWAAINTVAGEADASMVEGMDPPYAIPDVSIYHVPVRLALPTGPMRGGAHGYTCFMRECFIDEVAQRHELEPLSYRIAMLGGDLRLAACLQRAARLAAWDGGARGTGQGLACHRMGEGTAAGRIAVIASASAGEGGVRVSRIDAAVDIGRVVNRDIALQQVEGGIVFALGNALGCATGYDDGRANVRTLAEMQMPALAESPRINVELVESDAESFDPGEIGVPAVAPAIANALYSATGLRLRRLPLLSGGL